MFRCLLCPVPRTFATPEEICGSVSYHSLMSLLQHAVGRVAVARRYTSAVGIGAAACMNLFSEGANPRLPFPKLLRHHH